MRPRRVARQLWRGAALAGIGLAGGAAIVTARHLMMTPQPLESGLPGEGRIDRLHGGDIYYVVAGPADARPVVLLHGFYPGASNFEFRAIFSRLAESYRVYAPDWLGFGMSERPALTHTGEFYAASLTGFLRDVVGAPAAVVAHGLAGNIATRAASDAPELFERLTLVAPAAEAGLRLDPTPAQVAARFLQKVALGLTPYAITSLRPALRLAASQRSIVGPRQVDDETLDHLYASAHQFGGEYAALSLMTGELDLPIRQVFPLLQTPTLLIVGARDRRHSLIDMERLVALNPRADLEVVSNAGETVYLDQPTLFANALRRWLSRRIAHHERAPEQTRLAARESTPLAEVAPTTPITSAAPVASAPPEAPTPLVASEAPPATEPEPPAPAVKVIPVLEAPSDVAAPPEVQVTRMPDDEALESAPEAADAAQTLTLEPTSETNDASAPPSNTASGTAARIGWPEPRRLHGSQSAQGTTLQQSGFRYAPETGAHVMRSGRGSGRSPRGRHGR